jgi:hypothetical protein
MMGKVARTARNGRLNRQSSQGACTCPCTEKRTTSICIENILNDVGRRGEAKFPLWKARTLGQVRRLKSVNPRTTRLRFCFSPKSNVCGINACTALSVSTLSVRSPYGGRRIGRVSPRGSRRGRIGKAALITVSVFSSPFDGNDDRIHLGECGKLCYLQDDGETDRKQSRTKPNSDFLVTQLGFPGVCVFAP